MKRILLGAFAAFALAAGSAAVVVASGVVDVGADVPHDALVHRVLEFARERSIARRAAGIEPPGNLADAERLRRGAGNYDAMCADCHLAPGQADSEIRKGLYPVPPKLPQRRDAGTGAARDFWVIKHGVKSTGMPAWAKGGIDDEAIWDLAALLQKLPELAPADYQRLVAASDGHRHGGVDGHAHEAAPEKPPAAAAKKPAGHDHSAHDHTTHRH